MLRPILGRGCSDRVNMIAMTELLVAVVTAIASFLTTRGWPTLARRVRDHTAMVKDMPADVAVELKNLLAAEVAQLAVREAGRLNRTINTLLNLRRAAWVATVASCAAILLLGGITAGQDKASLAEGLTILALSVISFLSLVTALFSERMLRKPRTPGQEQWTSSEGRLSPKSVPHV